MKSRLRKKAKVPNVSDPYFSDETVLEIIRNAGYGAYIDKYKRAPTGTGNDQQGFYGQWTRQNIAGSEIEFPMIYYTELYPFIKGGKAVTFLVAWRYDTDGKLVENDPKNPVVTKIDDFANKAKSRLSTGLRMDNGVAVLGEFASYAEANK